MTILFMVLTVAVFLSDQSCGIPIAKAMGCGKSASLSIEKRIFCCEHFNLDCLARAVKAVQVDDIGNESGSVGSHINAKLVRIRTLGEDCKYPADQCAVGLRCKGGYCLRERSNAHLKALLDRGKLVEEEERGVSDSGTDEEPADPLPAQKGLILKGQALKDPDSFSSENSNLLSSLRQGPRETPSPKTRTPLRPYSSTSQHMTVEGQPVKSSTPRKTATPLRPYTSSYQDITVEGQAVKVGDSLSTQEGGLKVPPSRGRPSSARKTVSEDKRNDEAYFLNDDKYRPKPLMEEEDEVAANIADLLASKLGVSLDSEEMHDIRELISGTLDERAEREDEVAENIKNQVEENMIMNSEVQSSVPQEKESISNREEHTTRYEPLVQCASDGTVRHAANEISKTMKNLEEQAERFVHVAL